MTEIANRDLEEINARLAHLESLLGRGAEMAGGHATSCGQRGCPHKQRLRETIVETIGVLEVSRKAFRSRQLELLRGKLTKELAELA